jgi:hypothetical protein
MPPDFSAECQLEGFLPPNAVIFSFLHDVLVKFSHSRLANFS